MSIRKLVATTICAILVSTTAVAAQDAADAAAEAAGSYLGAVHVLQAAKKTQCGYALLMDVEDLSRKAEQDVLKTLPAKYKKDVASFIFHQRVKTTGFQPVSFSCENEEAGGVRWTTDTAVTRYFRSSITLCG